MTYSQHKRYDDYRRRMKILYNVLRIIKRYRIAIGCAIGVAGVALITFLLTIGTFTSLPSISDYEYGNVAAPTAKAFRSQVRFEYAELDSFEWSSEAPRKIGTYKVRAVSQNGFGFSRYSPSVTFSVIGRDITLEVKDKSCVYGEVLDYQVQDIAATGLLLGDRIESASFDYRELGIAEILVSIAGFTIVNGDGEDVTASYAVETIDKVNNLVARSIAMSSGSVSKTYDGTALSGGNITISYGSLAKGDSFKIASRASAVNAGTEKNAFSVEFTNKNGDDVTKCYDVKYNFGNLEIKPIELTLSTISIEKTYDGVPRSYDGYSIKEGKLLSGHILKVSDFPSVVAVGTVENMPKSYVILDKEGNDVTSNYKINWVCGDIKINPIKIEISTSSASKVYDGTPLTSHSYTKTRGTPAYGHSIVVDVTGSQLNAGTSNNTATVKIIDKNGKDVTKEGYEVSVLFGTLTITKRSVTIDTVSAEKLYDGTPLTKHAWRRSNFVDGHFPRLNFTGSQTAVGSSSNTATLQGVSDGSGNDVTKNYEVSITFGTLTVTANPNYRQNEESDDTTIGFPKPGDGGGISAEVQFTTPHDTEYVYFRQKSYGDYTYKGWKKASVYTGTGSSQSLFFVGTQLRNKKGDSSSVAPTIEIDKKGTNLSLLPYYSHWEMVDNCTKNDVFVTFSAEVYSTRSYVGFTYDDIKNYTSTYINESTYCKYAYSEYLDIPESTKKELLRIAEENGIKANSPTLITDIQNYIQHAAKYDMEAEYLYPANVEDIALYFLKTAKAGICQHFATAATLMYRAFGIPARYTVGYLAPVQYGKVTKLSSDLAHAWTEIYIDGLGWVCMEVTGGDGDGGGGGGGGGGTPTHPELEIQLYSTQKIYDGQPMVTWSGDKYSIVEGELLQGHRLVVEINDEGAGKVDAGNYKIAAKSYKIVDASGKDVTTQYKNIQIHNGVATILPRPIKIQAASATKKNDGTSLKCDEYWIANGSVLPEHEVSAVVSGELKVTGKTTNKISTVNIVDRKTGVSVKGNYKVVLTNGTLTIYD